MESKNQFLTKAAEVLKKAQSNYEVNKKVLEEDKESLKKIYNNFSSACDYLTQEMKEGVESIQKVLRLAAQDEDSSKSGHLLECVEEIFNKSITEEKHNPLADTQGILQNYLKEKRDEVFRIRTLLSDYRLSVGFGDMKEKQNPSTSQIQLAAPTLLKISPVLPFCCPPETGSAHRKRGKSRLWGQDR